MIHEYLHKITHPDYSDKARLLGRAKQQVFTEGGTSYFDERVWKTLYPEEVRASPELREKVEGAVYLIIQILFLPIPVMNRLSSSGKL